MPKHCLSCSMPIEGDGKYCEYCTDAEGNLKPRAEVQQGIAYWLQTLTPEDARANYLERAGFFIKAMPAWAEE